MVHKVRASAKRKVSHLANNFVTMVIVDGAALGELSHVKLPDDTRVAIIPGKSDSFQDIRSAIGAIKTEVEEFAVQRRSRSARFGAKRFGKARTIIQAAFAPDVRGRAILEGVRVAQQDLEDAGGAYDLEQVRSCCAAFPDRQSTSACRKAPFWQSRVQAITAAIPRFSSIATVRLSPDSEKSARPCLSSLPGRS